MKIINLTCSITLIPSIKKSDDKVSPSRKINADAVISLKSVWTKDEEWRFDAKVLEQCSPLLSPIQSIRADRFRQWLMCQHKIFTFFPKTPSPWHYIRSTLSTWRPLPAALASTVAACIAKDHWEHRCEWTKTIMRKVAGMGFSFFSIFCHRLPRGEKKTEETTKATNNKLT